jgi:hypothetical protein
MLFWHGRTAAFGVGYGVAAGIAYGIVLVVLYGVLYGVTAGIAAGATAVIERGSVRGTGVAIAVGIAAAVALGITNGLTGRGTLDLSRVGLLIAIGLAGGVVVGVITSIIRGFNIGITWSFASCLALGIRLAIAGKVGGFSPERIAAAVIASVAFGVGCLRVFYLPGHVMWLWPDLRPATYAAHPVVWADLCSVPFPGLCRMLAARAKIDRTGGNREIDWPAPIGWSGVNVSA